MVLPSLIHGCSIVFFCGLTYVSVRLGTNPIHSVIAHVGMNPTCSLMILYAIVTIWTTLTFFVFHVPSFCQQASNTHMLHYEVDPLEPVGPEGMCPPNIDFYLFHADWYIADVLHLRVVIYCFCLFCTQSLRVWGRLIIFMMCFADMCLTIALALNSLKLQNSVLITAFVVSCGFFMRSNRCLFFFIPNTHPCDTDHRGWWFVRLMRFTEDWGSVPLQTSLSQFTTTLNAQSLLKSELKTFQGLRMIIDYTRKQHNRKSRAQQLFSIMFGWDDATQPNKKSTDAMDEEFSNNDNSSDEEEVGSPAPTLPVIAPHSARVEVKDEDEEEEARHNKQIELETSQAHAASDNYALGGVFEIKSQPLPTLLSALQRVCKSTIRSHIIPGLAFRLARLTVYFVILLFCATLLLSLMIQDQNFEGYTNARKLLQHDSMHVLALLTISGIMYIHSMELPLKRSVDVLGDKVVQTTINTLINTIPTERLQ